MKKRNWVIGSVLAGTLLTAGAVYAGGGCGGPGFGPGGFEGGRGGNMMRMVEQLDLTKEQRQAVWAIMDEQRNKMRDKRADMVDIRKALHEAATSANYDATKVRELADTKAKMMSDMMVERTETMNRIRKVLTAEQVKKLDDTQYRFFGRGHS